MKQSHLRRYEYGLLISFVTYLAIILKYCILPDPTDSASASTAVNEMMMKQSSFEVALSSSSSSKTKSASQETTTTTTTKIETTNHNDKEPIIQILKLANIEIQRYQHPRPSNHSSDGDSKSILRRETDEYQALPSWSQVIARFGDQPRIVGLETCADYRSSVPKEQRKIAPAGMFSTGTNLLYKLLKDNCQLSMGNHTKKAHSFVGWQVNWGKHQSPRFRSRHHVEPKKTPDNSVILPIVTVRDPWTWMQSMCHVRYSAHWFHAPDHCPNFIPNEVEEEWYNQSKSFVRKYFHRDPWLVDNIMEKANFTLHSSKVIPLWVRYKMENAHHTSLAHMWKDWNQEYWDAFVYDNGTSTAKSSTNISTSTGISTTFPRLMIRLEDLVFFPNETLSAICECAGGTMIMNPISLLGETSKTGDEEIHGSNKTDLRTAMISHIYTNRSKGMTRADIDYVIPVLKDSVVREAFGYAIDPRW